MLRSGFFDSEIIGYDEEGMPIFDRAESSDFLALFISSIISDGVLALPGDCFQVIADKGMNLKVRPGLGIIRGRFAYDKKEFGITIAEAHTDIGHKRIDRIILRANYRERLCEIVVKQGTAASDPVPPSLLRPESGDYYELCLAYVTINSKQTTISQSDITDTRLDSNVCGLVTQAIDHLDTSVFYNQLQTKFVEMVAEYTKWKNSFTANQKTTFDTLNADYTAKMKKFLSDSAGQFDTWFSESTTDWTEKFYNWFNILKDQLTDNAALNLQNQIYSINAVLREITESEIDEIIAGTYEGNEGGMEPDIYSRISDEEIDNIVNNAFQ